MKIQILLLCAALSAQAEEPKFEESLKDIQKKVSEAPKPAAEAPKPRNENRKENSQGGEINVLPSNEESPRARCFFHYTNPIEIDYPWADWSAASLGHEAEHWHDNEINFFLEPGRYKDPKNPFGASHWFRIVDAASGQRLATIGYNEGNGDPPNLGIADEKNMNLEEDRSKPSHLYMNRPNALRIVRKYKHGFLGLGKETELMVECSYPWNREK